MALNERFSVLVISSRGFW